MACLVRTGSSDGVGVWAASAVERRASDRVAAVRRAPRCIQRTPIGPDEWVRIRISVRRWTLQINVNGFRLAAVLGIAALEIEAQNGGRKRRDGCSGSGLDGVCGGSAG
jgi:hypothetical protein